MRISHARVIICAPGRNFVTLKIETEDGISGIGDATLNGRELAVAAYLQEHVAPTLIGRDARRIEDAWQYLYRGAYWRRGPVTMAAIAAVDVALWDIKAKALGQPLYQLLGGASRERMLCYGHANGATAEAAEDAVAALVGRGFRAVRVQAGVPGLPLTYGVGAGSSAVAGAVHALPRETPWDSDAYLRFAPSLLARMRARFGAELHLLHDVHHRLTPIEAARLGRELEPLRLFWLEDPTPAENQEVLRLIRRHTTTPLAVGEVFNSIHDCDRLLREQLIDYIRATPVHAGGITHLRRIADLAGHWQVRTACHGAPDMSPVTFGAALHFGRWVPNFGIQEYTFHAPEAHEVFPHAWRYEDGHLHCGEAPGHGVEIDEAAAAKFPYRRSYLDVARLPDGTLWNW